ncbi:GAF domain-containing protein [Leptolyngbya sp. BC1307]|uniref:GAF domain-containing protein n=1 Tax=Leptolyngbya sp. BC1307 TaxID=2029589 RepID=UPI000EFBB714|nr:GAF domain-containing protein [Leptolyngbya sp. BC1307]
MVKSTVHSVDPQSSHRLSKQDLSQVLPAIWEAETLERSIQTALEAIQAEFGYSLLWMGLYDRFNHKLTTRGVLTQGPRRFSHTSLSLHPGDVLEQVIMRQRPMVIADIRAESRAGAWARIATLFELQGTVVLPIQRRGLCFGLMVLCSRQWGATPGILENSTLLAINNALAEAIHQNALEQQRQQTKQPAKPLLALLGSLDNLSGLDARLQLVAEETQKFVGAPVSIYWLELRGRNFWCRVGKLKGKPNATLPVNEVQTLYQSLCAEEMVAFGEIEGSLKASMASRLMQHLSAQSLMAAPIVYHNELQGFISVEGANPRIWSEVEKEYVQGVARLIGLAMPIAEMDAALSQVKSDHLLSAGVTRSIHSDRDWQHVLGLCVEQLAARIGTDQLLVLSANLDRGGFDLCYRTGHDVGRAEHWLPLDTVDEKMLKRAHSPVSIESLSNDLKFAVWRSHFQAMGVESLLVSSTSPGRLPEGLIIVTDKIDRRWSQTERELLQTLSRQIGLILHQWQLQRQTDQQAQLHETFQWGMRSLQRLSHIDHLDQSATRHIAQLLHVPLVAIITWEHGEAFAKASHVLVQNKSFQLDTNRHISVETDAMLNWAVSTEGLLALRLEDLPTDDQQWISGPAQAQILAMALRTAPEHEPNAVIVVADGASRQWSEEQTTLLAIVVNQLAWCRRHLKLTATMLERQQQLTQLNWYKQHQIEDLNRGLRDCLQQLRLQPSAADARRQLLLQKMNTLAERLAHIADRERWAIKIHAQSTPIISLLKRAMTRAKPLLQERQLWSKVHCESNLNIFGDITKLEFVLYELIAEACDRSPLGDRIDIWCRPVNQQWIEVSITDEGTVAPQVLQELAQGRPADLLSPSILQQPHHSHLWVCQTLMQQLGGEFTLTQMEDGRTLSRVMLPLGEKA